MFITLLLLALLLFVALYLLSILRRETGGTTKGPLAPAAALSLQAKYAHRQARIGNRYPELR